MRGKRSKQYRKLMQQYALTFGFREPYQVVVDAEMLHDAHRFAMDLPASLARTLHGDVKVMITSCSIRHLYALPVATSSIAVTPTTAKPAAAATTASEPHLDAEVSAFLTTPIASDIKTALLAVSKRLTLRKCNHHVLAAPLAPLECLRSVMDPSGTGANKHRLVLAAQDGAARAWTRRHVRGVPSIYLRRSIMLLEPMSPLSARERATAERGKIRGLPALDPDKENDPRREGGAEKEPVAGKKRRKGPKGPNPLSVKKKKPKSTKPAEGAKVGSAE